MTDVNGNDATNGVEDSKRRGIIVLTASAVAVATLAGTAIWGISSAYRGSHDNETTTSQTQKTEAQSQSQSSRSKRTADSAKRNPQTSTQTEKKSDTSSEAKKDVAQPAQNSQNQGSQNQGAASQSAPARPRTRTQMRNSRSRGASNSNPTRNTPAQPAQPSRPGNNNSGKQTVPVNPDKTTKPNPSKPADETKPQHNDSDQPVVWGYGADAIKDSKNALKDNQVRESPFYSVKVGNVSSDKKLDSFTYLSIPRGGLGKVGYNGTDGAEFAAENGFTMSWSSFVYSKDVWVNVSLNTGAKISSADDVTIRPTSLKFEKKMVDDHTIAVKVPFNQGGYRFSVEFASEQTKVFANGAGGAVTEFSTAADKDDQLKNAKDYIETEPRNSMMVFAQPKVEGTDEGKATIPTAQDGKMLVLEPGEFPKTIADDVEIIYLKSGSHWMGSKRQAEFGPSVRWVYFEPGAYLKGALKFTGNPKYTNYKLTGYGVLSTEQYGYETSTTNGFNHRPDKDDQCWNSCVKPMLFTSDAIQQKLDLQGLTVKEPSYHSYAHYAYVPKDAEEAKVRPMGSEETFSMDIRNYQQVGAWYWQTDGLDLHTGSTMRDTFFHANDDVIKLYHDNVKSKNVVIWKNENGPIFQWGWVGRNINNVHVENTEIIHSRMYWGGNSNMCVFNSAGDLWGGSHKESPAPNYWVQNMTFKNTRVEGTLNCGIRIDNQGSMKNVTIDGFYVDDWTGQRQDLQQSTLKMAKSWDGKYGTFGDKDTANGLIIRNYYVKGQGISFADENWQGDQLGRLAFDPSLEGQWTVGYDGEATGKKPEITVDSHTNGQTVESRDLTLKGSVKDAKSVTIDVNGKEVPGKVSADGKFEATIHLDRVSNSVRILAQSETGVKSAKYIALTAFGNKMGSIADAKGDDNGPGSYTYPTNGAFAEGNFDMTNFDAYDDGDSYNFVTSLATEINNPWGGNGISTQQLNIYLRDGKATDDAVVPLRKGTQTYVKGAWKYAIIADGRYNPGVYAPDGTKVGDLEISAIGNRLAVTVKKSVIKDIDAASAQYEVSLYSSAEGGEGVDNVRPVYSAACFAGTAEGCTGSWLHEYRFGGAKGVYQSESPFITDTTASNAIDILVGDEKANGTQTEIMSLDKDQVVVPYVTLAK
ncbi:dextranase [Alloscardovia theropitheci]|uniref:Dextranase n=1 Tax=Alloscardovia theropitheci TaxID=2496842 RepID=A0A4R0QQ52_9BIFI|nr:glucodextranase DOMON-like domain-containing protein [Alloscardovia theropitheci]TCD54422.1 dextranase [Alloscardovia theropitheci]